MARWQYRWKLQPLAFFQVHGSMDVHALRQGGGQGVALGFQVVPDHEMLIRRGFVDDALCLSHPGGDALALFPGSIPQPEGGVAHEFHLPVGLASGIGQVGLQAVVANFQRRQAVAFVAVA